MAFVLSFMMGANAQVTEVLGAPSADRATFTGTSFTAGEGEQLTTGTQAVSGKTFLKIRTGNEGNSLTFSVIDGYAITGISMDAYSNNKSTSADRSINLTAVNIDEAESNILENVVKLPGGTAGQTPINVSLSGFEAKKSIKMTFDNSNIVTETEDPAGKNKQIFAYIEVTYIALNADPVAEPAIKFTAGAAERTITLGLSAAGKVSVDWGNGEKVEQEATAAYDGSNGLEFTGTPSGEVKIYAEGINYLQAFTKYAAGVDVITDGITAIDLSKATTITELDLHQNNLTAVDLSKLTALTSLNIGVNDFTTIDLSANTELTSIDLSNSKNNGVLETIDLSKNTKLTKVVLSGNKLKTLDFTANPLIKTFMVLDNQLTSVIFGENTAAKHTIQFGGNKLTTLDLTQFTTFDGTYLRVRDNDLTEIKLPGQIKQLWADGNNFTLAQLYALKNQAQTLTYATTFTKPQAQAPYVIDKVIESGDAIDLSSQAKLGETETVFTWINKADTLKAGTDYTVENGVFTFLTAQDSLYCVMTNTELPLIKYTTTATRVVVLPVAIKLTAGNVERSITVGLSDAGIVKVDWGNGELIKKIAAAAYDGWDNALEFTGTPSGEVKIYGENINYLQSFTKYADGATVITDGITAIDLSKATTITELDLHQNNLTTVDLSKLTALTSLNIGVNDFTTIDLSALTELVSLDITNGKLTELDLSKNTKLTKVVLSGNKLQTLDFTNNPLIRTFTVLNNELTNVTIGANTAKGHTFQFGGNKLTSFSLKDATDLATSYVYLRDNSLTSLELPSNVKRIWVDGNAFTLAQLADLKRLATQTFTYASTFTKPQAQAPYAIAESVKVGETIDLSSQALLGETATEFVWINKADTLKAGTDYNVENGVFTFLTAQDSLYCEMTNAELPAIKYTTTATKVEAEATGIQTIQMKGIEKVYNLKGQRIAAPVKGLYIRNGKKYVK